MEGTGLYQREAECTLAVRMENCWQCCLVMTLCENATRPTPRNDAKRGKVGSQIPPSRSLVVSWMDYVI